MEAHAKQRKRKRADPVRPDMPAKTKKKRVDEQAPDVVAQLDDLQTKPTKKKKKRELTQEAHAEPGNVGAEATSADDGMVGLQSAVDVFLRLKAERLEKNERI